MPRMVKLALVKFVLVKVTLGRESCRSDVFLICCFSSASVLKALTAIGTDSVEKLPLAMLVKY